MRNLPKIFIFILLLLCVKNIVISQQISFNKLTPPDGKNFEFVTGITQDNNGIMWFSTKKGLYNYDGNRVKSFKNDPLNPNSIVSNLLESIYADTNGNIWIGSLGKGLDLFDAGTGIFTHFHHDPDNPGSLSNDSVTSILRDKYGTLWIGTHGGLDQYDPKTNAFIHYRNKEGDPTSLSNNVVRRLYIDKQGTFWIGTGSPYPNDGGGPESGGLNRFDYKSATFTRYLHEPGNDQSLLSNKISAIFEDDQGILWIGTSRNGLHKMNRQQGTFERLIYDPSHPEKFSAPAIDPNTSSFEHITFITQDAAGSYWFGTVEAGLYYFNPAKGRIVNFKRSENSSPDFIDNGAFKAFISRDNVVWIGGTNGNIYHIDPLHKEIPHIAISATPVSVNAFYEDGDGTFWIGTSHELIRIDEEKGIEERYKVNPAASNDDENVIYTIQGDRLGNMWVGSSGGLNLWDKKNERLIHYKNDPKDRYSISNNSAISIFEDSKSNFWIGTFNGLNLMDRKSGSFSHYFIYPVDSNSNNGRNLVTSVIEDKTGKLWITCWNGAGVSLFNPESRKFKLYLKGANLIDSFEDSDGVLWVAGSDGLYRYDRNVDDFVRYTNSGLPFGLSEVFSIVEDDQKYLWIGTADGIVRINPQRSESSLFGKNYGVSENTLNFGSCYKRRNGAICFGDATGYFSFFPVDLINNSKVPEIVFTDFRLANQIFSSGNDGPISKQLSQLPEIRLRHDQNVFSFDFAAVDYSNPEENRMIYLLENYDKNWSQPNSENRAYYFNVPAGKYTFRVKAVNSYGAWAEKKIDVLIMPPWWGTWWAYCIYGLLFLALIFGIDRFQRHRLLERERRQTRERELRQAHEIEKAYNQLKTTQSQLVHAEKMASLGELTAGIAHEIQNPLNFVNNFSEVNLELIGELKEGLDHRDFDEVKSVVDDLALNEEKINYHGKRADAIVKGMLQHSRTSNGLRTPTDINALSDEYLRLAYHGFRAKDKSFNAIMKTDFDNSIGTINVIAQDIGRVILNLITNAFYAVDVKKKQLFSDLSALSNLTGQNDYEPTVSVSTKKTGNKVLIAVKDNGNGIPEKNLEKIFQPFFTTKPTGQGTGLGLSLSYDIVKAHGGELKVETKENEFTVFTISIPV